MSKITIPIGPQHPALKEPASFKITLDGEEIYSMDMRLGYNHRGIERACEERSYIQSLYLIERICGICSHSHSTAYIQALEELAGLQVPKRGLYIRMLIGELERIHSHLLWLGVAAHEVGFDTLLMYTWRDRELVMDHLAEIGGNRVNYAVNTLGGVRRDLTREEMDHILKDMDTLEERTKYYAQVATEEPTLIARLSKVGMLSKAEAVHLGAVGPTARACGVDRDVRRDDPYAAYGDVQFKVCVDDHCDVYGRVLVRIGELMEAYNIIRQVVKNIPDGPIAVKAPRRIAAGEVYSRYEAPRGEDCHYVKSNGTDKPDRVKIRAPTLANWRAVRKMIEGNYLADAPIIIAAIDPCFSCTDRAIELVRPAGAETLTWGAVRQHGIEWYRRQGIDFAELNKKLGNQLGRVR